METLDVKAKFRNKLPQNDPNTEYIILANDETANYQNSVFVVVENTITQQVMFNISINCVIPETFYRGITVLNNCLIVAVENYIYIFNIKTRNYFQFKIDGFFDSFCLEDQKLLVRSDTHITCIDRNNKVIWNSERVEHSNEFMRQLTQFPDQNSVNWKQQHQWADLKIHFLNGLHLEN